MLSFQTVRPDTLELLKALMQLPTLKDMRLVGGTALALQYGHRRSVVSMSCFADAAPQAMPYMFKSVEWYDVKQKIKKLYFCTHEWRNPFMKVGVT